MGDVRVGVRLALRGGEDLPVLHHPEQQRPEEHRGGEEQDRLGVAPELDAADATFAP